ncbi:MAG: hypothetical protein KKC75_01100 [Nanoarchaeota archaeon]|nr:hypothetical protein [Nanoarchaeota archaeon]MBU1005899.1 hypothetical protein [Nanoarchaeota archaeon]MBU1946538.1 hypothetical protein [Nanoarchaeota archaeon]
MDCYEDRIKSGDIEWSIDDFQPPEEHTQKWNGFRVSNDGKYISEVESRLRGGFRQQGVEFSDFVKGSFGVVDTLVSEVEAATLSIDVVFNDPNMISLWFGQYPAQPEEVLRRCGGDCVERAFAVNYVARKVGLEAVAICSFDPMARCSQSSSAIKLPDRQEGIIVYTGNADSQFNPPVGEYRMSWLQKEQEQLSYEWRIPLHQQVLKKVTIDNTDYLLFFNFPKYGCVPPEFQGKFVFSVDVKPATGLPRKYYSDVFWCSNLEEAIEALRETDIGSVKDATPNAINGFFHRGLFFNSGFAFEEYEGEVKEISLKELLHSRETYLSVLREVVSGPLRFMLLNLDRFSSPFESFDIEEIKKQIETSNSTSSK